MGEWITLVVKDGHHLSTYRAASPGPSSGGIVIVQEVFGVNGHIRDVCDRFAEAGYQALAAALYGRLEPGVELGYSAVGRQRARSLRACLDLQLALADVDAAARYLARSQPVEVTGFYYGATLAWLAAAELSLDATITYYGTFIHGFRDRLPQCSVLLYFGEEDDLIPYEHIEDILDHNPNLPLTVELYPGAHHGFNCDLRDSFDRYSASQAWERTLVFLSQHLEPSPPGPGRARF